MPWHDFSMSLPMDSGISLATRSFRSQLVASRVMISVIFLRIWRIYGRQLRVWGAQEAGEVRAAGAAACGVSRHDQGKGQVFSFPLLHCRADHCVALLRTFSAHRPAASWAGTRRLC